MNSKRHSVHKAMIHDRSYTAFLFFLVSGSQMWFLTVQGVATSSSFKSEKKTLRFQLF